MDIVQKIQAQLKANENEGMVLLQGFGLNKFDAAWIPGAIYYIIDIGLGGQFLIYTCCIIDCTRSNVSFCPELRSAKGLDLSANKFDQIPEDFKTLDNRKFSASLIFFCVWGYYRN